MQEDCFNFKATRGRSYCDLPRSKRVIGTNRFSKQRDEREILIHSRTKHAKLHKGTARRKECLDIAEAMDYKSAIFVCNITEDVYVKQRSQGLKDPAHPNQKGLTSCHGHFMACNQAPRAMVQLLNDIHLDHTKSSMGRNLKILFKRNSC
ncbi:hypothetical protein Tco_1411159 [Tanacetum coccineum]